MTAPAKRRPASMSESHSRPGSWPRTSSHPLPSDSSFVLHPSSSCLFSDSLPRYLLGCLVHLRLGIRLELPRLHLGLVLQLLGLAGDLSLGNVLAGLLDLVGNGGCSLAGPARRRKEGGDKVDADIHPMLIPSTSLSATARSTDLSVSLAVSAAVLNCGADVEKCCCAETAAGRTDAAAAAEIRGAAAATRRKVTSVRNDILA